jgi:hypothetical protein
LADQPRSSAACADEFGGRHLNSFEDLHQRLSDSVPFPNGRWPKATDEFTSDGSITDGDTTAWRLTT